MKTLYLWIFFMCAPALFAQKTAEELARQVFKTCLKNDERSFKRYYPQDIILKAYFKAADKKKLFPKEVVKQCYPKGYQGAQFGLKLFQKALKEFKVNPADIKITGSDINENDIEIMKGGKKVGAVYNYFVSLYFTSGGRKYAFVVPKAIVFKGRWFIGDQVVSLHDL